tara:strand:+ start:56 stop:472 length:417 start_codon:yes stop_codon:yes gene_type:complete
MKNIDIVCTSYHKPQIEKMLDVAKKAAEEENITVENIYWLPGVLEIPYGIRKVNSNNVDGFVVLGIIEKGKTKHGKVIGQTVINDLIKFQTGTDGKPVGIGIIGPGATPEQIEERLEMHAKNAVLAVSHLIKDINEWK